MGMVANRLCDQNISYEFWLTYHKESSHEIGVQLAEWFLRKLCFNMLMGLQYERLCLKGQRSTLTFETYLLGLTYQVRIMTGFNRIQKINFSKNFPFKCIRKQI